MDGFTAKLILDVAASDTDQAITIHESLQPKELPATLGRDMDRANAMKGQRCTIQHTPYTGTVVGANMARGGFYGGERYPVLVCIDEVNDGSKNVTFEYGFDQVILEGES